MKCLSWNCLILTFIEIVKSFVFSLASNFFSCLQAVWITHSPIGMIRLFSSVSGIKTSGDIVKALAAGSDLVMIGSLLSGTDETPGKFIETNAGKVKEYRGMASSAAMSNRPDKNNLFTPTAEGVKALVSAKGSAIDIVNDLTKGLKSGMSYCNAHNISDINIKSKWGIRTMSGLSDGKPHILGSAI